MAELVDVVVSLLESTAAFGDFGDIVTTSVRRKLLTLIVLTAGKCADIVADWVIVFQLADGSLSLREDASITLAVAVCLAVLGSAIEVIASLMKLRLYCISEGASRMLKSIKLNGRLALPRFLLDDAPAAALGIYLLITPMGMGTAGERIALLPNGTVIDLGNATFANASSCTTTLTTTTIFTSDGPRAFTEPSTECGDAVGVGLTLRSAEFWLVALSCGYSLCAMLLAVCASPDGLRAGLEEQGARLSSLRRQVRNWSLPAADVPSHVRTARTRVPSL
jgi:hypothetical protein